MTIFKLIKEFINQLSTNQIKKLLNNVLSPKDLSKEIKERYYEIFNSPIELIVCVLSTMNDNKFYEDFSIPTIDNLYLTILEEMNFPMNTKSILLKDYIPNQYYYTYIGIKTDQKDVKNFMDKYSYDTKFGFEIDLKLAKINFEKQNYNAFIQFDSEEKIDSYEIKHFMICKFYDVWDMYLKEIHEKDIFFEKIIKEHFCNINWITMSRLYNPDDKEFVDKFSEYINISFAKLYNPKFTRCV